MAAAGRGRHGRVDQLVAQLGGHLPVDVRTLLQHSGRLAHSVTLATRTGRVMTPCTGDAQVIDGGSKAGLSVCSRQMPVQVDPLPGLVREPGDGVGDDVRPVAAELLRGDDLLRGAEQDRLGDQPLAVGGVDRGACPRA